MSDFRTSDPDDIASVPFVQGSVHGANAVNVQIPGYSDSYFTCNYFSSATLFIGVFGGLIGGPFVAAVVGDMIWRRHPLYEEWRRER